MRISDWSSDVCSSDLEDLLSYGVTTQIEGRNLTDDELVGFAFNLFIGGLDTVSTNIAWQFRHLAENPDHQATLRANPAMIPDAIEEMMRAYARSEEHTSELQSLMRTSYAVFCLK